MKKNIILALCASTLLFSCGRKTKEKVCTANNNWCELEKDWCLIQVVSLDRDTNSIDAFGDKLNVGKFYLRCRKSRMLFPVMYEAENPNFISYNSVCVLNTPKNPNNPCPILQTAKLDDGGVIMSIGYYDFIGRIVCIKDGEVFLDKNHAPQYVCWIGYK